MDQPCSVCSTQAATRLCRECRSAKICGASCWGKHAAACSAGDAEKRSNDGDIAGQPPKKKGKAPPKRKKTKEEVADELRKARFPARFVGTDQGVLRDDLALTAKFGPEYDGLYVTYTPDFIPVDQKEGEFAAAGVTREALLAELEAATYEPAYAKKQWGLPDGVKKDPNYYRWVTDLTYPETTGSNESPPMPLHYKYSPGLKVAIKATPWKDLLSEDERARGQEKPQVQLLAEIIARSLNLPDDYYNSVLLNYYPTGGASLSAHADDDKWLYPQKPPSARKCKLRGRHKVTIDQVDMDAEVLVPSISIGAVRKFHLAQNLKGGGKGTEVDLYLNPWSLAVMRGTTQQKWTHGIPPQASVKERRFNLTFRHICQESVLASYLKVLGAADGTRDAFADAVDDDPSVEGGKTATQKREAILRPPELVKKVESLEIIPGPGT